MLVLFLALRRSSLLFRLPVLITLPFFGVPPGALFFAAKDAFSTAISNASGGQFADLTTVAAVGLAQFPYWGIRTPAELLKIRWDSQGDTAAVAFSFEARYGAACCRQTCSVDPKSSLLGLLS